MEFEKKRILHNDRVRIDYLKEQSSIAKELNIIDNQIEFVQLSQSNVSFNINTANNEYYLRGYKAIDKEIELLQNRKYLNYDLIKQEINNLKDLEIEIIDFNIYLMDTKYLKDTTLNLILFILLGLVIGVFFVIILNSFQLKKN